MNNDFWSLMRYFANNFHKWQNDLIRDQKTVIHGNSSIILYVITLSSTQMPSLGETALCVYWCSLQHHVFAKLRNDSNRVIFCTVYWMPGTDMPVVKCHMTCTWIVYHYHWLAHVITAFYYCVHHDHRTHYHDHRMDYYDHQMDLTFKLHAQQLIRTLTLLGARSEWTQLHDKCQQIWLKSNLAHERNVLWDIDHSHWTHLYHRSNYFPGPQTRLSSQIIDATVYCLILGLVLAPEPILFE